MPFPVNGDFTSVASYHESTLTALSALRTLSLAALGKGNTSGHPTKEIGAGPGLAFTTAASGPRHRVLCLGFGAGMVFGKQAHEHLAAGGGADGVTVAVLFREGLDLVEVVFKVNILPAVGIANRDIECDVQPAQFEEGFQAGSGGAGILLRNLGDHLGRQVTGVEKVVGFGQAEPEGLHQCLTMRVVALPKFGDVGVGGLPEPGGESEGVEALRGRVAEILFQRTAVLASPDLVKGGLGHGEKVPAVGGKYVEGVSKDIVRRRRRKAQVLGGRSSDEAAREVADVVVETCGAFSMHPPTFTSYFSV